MSLDDTLAAWAATICLTASTAASICQQIVTTPAGRAISEGLDPAWWRGFTAGYTARMIASTRPPVRAA
jgi:hypothetical protein